MPRVNSRMIFDNSADVILITDDNFNILETNRTATQRLNYSREELLQLNMKNLDDPDFVKTNEPDQSNLCYNRQFIYETVHVTKTGIKIPTEINSRLIDFDESKAILSIARDITERKKYELSLLENEYFLKQQNEEYSALNEELRTANEKTSENEKKYNQLFENLQQGFAVHKMIYDENNEPVDYRFIMVNKAFEKLTGLSAGKLIGNTVKDIMPNIEDVWIKNYGKVTQTGIPITFENYARDLHKYYQVLAYSPAPDHFAVIFTDITLNKEYQIDLEKMNTDIQSMLKGAKVVLELNNFSSTAKQLFDICKENIKFTSGSVALLSADEKENHFVFFDSGDRPGTLNTGIRKPISKLLASVYKTNKPVICNDFENSGWFEMKPDDHIKFKNVLVAPLTINKKITGLLCLVNKPGGFTNNDLSIAEAFGEFISIALNNSKTMEELIAAKVKAEDSDRLKSIFLANMSHEIRTPMNAIVGFAQFLTKASLTEVQRNKFSSIIKDRTHDLLRIIEDLLDVSKIEAGQLKIFESDFLIHDLMNEFKEFYEQKLDNSQNKGKIIYNVTVPDNFKSLSIKADKQRLKQVLTNLLDNAFKFTQQGSIELGLDLVKESMLLFFVKDTGIGIPPEKQSIIFDRFRQADESFTSRKFSGSGLGLSICKGLADLMQGKIWVESSESGSTFYFSMPFVISEKSQGKLPDEVMQNTSSWNNKTVLIVEDDAANCELLTEFLSFMRIKVLSAANGRETVKMITEHPEINLILMDIRLPDTNGLILTKMIKKEHPGIIVIAQTAYAETDNIQECLDSGCTDFIAKPIILEKLNSILIEYLK